MLLRNPFNVTYVNYVLLIKTIWAVTCILILEIWFIADNHCLVVQQICEIVVGFVVNTPTLVYNVLAELPVFARDSCSIIIQVLGVVFPQLNM